MAADAPKAGDKVSLITKSGTRFEGTVDWVNKADESISLTNVKSFGTEDREAEVKVPAREQLYEFINFDERDVKTIEILESAATDEG